MSVFVIHTILQVMSNLGTTDVDCQLEEQLISGIVQEQVPLKQVCNG